MIKESFRWLLIRGNLKKAQSICYKVLQTSNGTNFNLTHIKSLDKVSNDKIDIEAFQPTLHRIISFFVLLWSITSLLGYFNGQENFYFADDRITSEISVNFIIGIFNLILTLIILK